MHTYFIVSNFYFVLHINIFYINKEILHEKRNSIVFHFIARISSNNCRLCSWGEKSFLKNAQRQKLVAVDRIDARFGKPLQRRSTSICNEWRENESSMRHNSKHRWVLKSHFTSNDFNEEKKHAKTELSTINMTVSYDAIAAYLESLISCLNQQLQSSFV